MSSFKGVQPAAAQDPSAGGATQRTEPAEARSRDQIVRSLRGNVQYFWAKIMPKSTADEAHRLSPMGNTETAIFAVFNAKGPGSTQMDIQEFMLYQLTNKPGKTTQVQQCKELEATVKRAAKLPANATHVQKLELLHQQMAWLAAVCDLSEKTRDLLPQIREMMTFINQKTVAEIQRAKADKKTAMEHQTLRDGFDFSDPSAAASAGSLSADSTLGTRSSPSLQDAPRSAGSLRSSSPGAAEDAIPDIEHFINDGEVV